MLKRILSFFRHRDDKKKIERKQDIEEPLEELLNSTKYNLSILKEREVNYRGFAPLELYNHIEEHQQAIALIEQAIKGDLSRPDLRQKLQLFCLYHSIGLNVGQVQVKDVEALQLEVEASLKNLLQTLDSLFDQVGSMPTETKVAVVELLHQARQQGSTLAAEWNSWSRQAAFSEKNLQALLTKLTNTRQSISILVQRWMHVRNLELLQEQLAQQQTALTLEVRHQTLASILHEQQEQISLLEQKVELSSHEQKLLGIYRHNFELCEQMLAGERAYAPLYILNQIEVEEQSVREIDAQLTGL